MAADERPMAQFPTFHDTEPLIPVRYRSQWTVVPVRWVRSVVLLGLGTFIILLQCFVWVVALIRDNEFEASIPMISFASGCFMMKYYVDKGDRQRDKEVEKHNGPA